MRHSIKLFLLGILFIPLFWVSCQKHLQGTDATEPEMIIQARAFVDSLNLHGFAVNYRASQPKKLRWDLARLVPVGHTQGLLVPIVYANALLMKANFVGDQFFHIDYLTQLLFYRDSTGKNTAQVITAFPDSNYFRDPTRSFTGIKFVEDWYGHRLQKLLYSPDGKIWRYTPNNKQPALAEVSQTCYSITGYNYSPELNETETWTEDAGCTVNFTDDGSEDAAGSSSTGPGTGGASGANGGSAITVLPGNSVIKSIKTYFQCYTNVGGTDHTYTVTVCVDQPDPGTRTPWTTSGNGSSGSSASGNPVYAGHTFLLLTETYGGTTITRNVGFYPAGNVNPTSPSSQGSLNDDETHGYNISGSFTIDNAQFFNILNFVSQGNNTGYLYNLNTNNCTTFAINAVAQAGITLPQTIGTWLGGAGDDPGDLGQDLRAANIPGMTLNLSGGTFSSHPNATQCN